MTAVDLTKISRDDAIAEVKRLRKAMLKAAPQLDWWADECEEFRVSQAMRTVAAGLRLEVAR